MRELKDVCPAAWMGGCLLTLPRMIDHTNEHGVVTAGFMPSLAPILGVGSFDHGNEETRFAALINSGSELGARFNAVWLDLQNEVQMGGVPATSGILAAAPQAAGMVDEDDEEGVNGLVVKGQRAITKQREKKRFAILQFSINNLGTDDERRQCFMNLNRTSQQFIGSAPRPGEEFMNADWFQANQDYFGLPSSQCAPFLGTRVGRRGATLDPYGKNLTTAVLPGDGWRKQHDAIKWEIDSWLSYAWVTHQCEPYGLFTACINQASQDEWTGQPLRKRQALVPDFLLSWGPEMPDEFDELKCCRGASYYNAATVLDRCGGVEKRARAIPVEYRRKARNVDIKFNDWDHAQGPGPVETRLNGYGAIRGLVFGARGESSKDVARLIKLTATIAAERRWRELGARSVGDARNAIMHSVRRSLGIVAVREAAKLKRERLGIVLGNGSAASERRRGAKRRAQRMHHDYANWAFGRDAPFRGGH